MDDVRFFDGQVQVLQPEHGYRAGTDAILLAASLAAKPKSCLLELGTGSAAVVLMANHRLENCQFVGAEYEAGMLALARKNTQAFPNIDIVEADVGALPKAWHLQFHQVFANPPYFDTANSVRMSDVKSPSFVNTDTKLADWLSSMLLMLKPRGTGTLIYRADGLDAILAGLFGKVGRIRILPVHSFADAPAKRMIVQFRKGVKSETAILPALVLHEQGSAEKFTSQVQDILNGKQGLQL